MKIAINYKSFIIAVLAAGFLLLSAIFVFGETADQNLPEGTTNAQVQGALGDLGRLYGQAVSTIAQAKEICNSEKFLTECADIGKRYNLYKPDEVKQVDALLTELKGKIVDDLKSCTDEACLIDVANRLAKDIIAKNPSLASKLDLTQEKIQEKKQIINVAEELGVNVKDCQTMDPDTASVELLRACAKLAKDSRVQKVILVDKTALQSIDSTLALKEALTQGKYQCGDGTLEGCGNFCLNPPAESRAQGVSAIPPICRDIANKFFGPEGVKHLESAYGQVNQIKEFYTKKAENIVFTTADGRTLVDPPEIGRYLEEQGKNGNVEEAEKGMDFMIAHGFIKPQDKEFALKMVRKVKEKGGIPDFNTCRQNPESCRDFVPEEFRAQFGVMEQVRNIMQQEIGFSPEECARASSDPALGQKCLEGSKKAIAKIESLGLGEKSKEAQVIISDIKSNLQREGDLSERKDEFKKVFESQGGPGGCKSGEECRTYCSDPTHGPECIAFGSKNKISGFEGREAIQRFQQFNQSIQGPQIFEGGGFPGQGFQGQGFPGQGPFPGFTPPGQGGFPPGQFPGFREPGPGFNPPPGVGGYPGLGGGPSLECFSAIQSGDFVKAKETCKVNIPQPVGFPGEQPSSVQPQIQTQPYTQPEPFSQPELQKGICPKLPTVSECPSGQVKIPVYSSPECGTYYGCKPAEGGTPTPGPYPSPGPYPAPGPYPYPTSTYPASVQCDWATQYLRVSTNTCLPKSNCSNSANAEYNSSECQGVRSTGGTQTIPTTPPSSGCTSGQYWNGTTCVSSTSGSTSTPPTNTTSPSTTPCPSGQYWNGTSCVSSTSSISTSTQPSTSCPSGQYWSGTACVSSTSGSTYTSPETHSCPSGQYWNGSTCVSSTSGSGSYTPPPSGSYSSDPATACAQSGGSWNGSSCVFPTTR